MSASQGQKYNSSFETVLHKRSDLHILRKLWHISTGSLGLFMFHQMDASTNTFAIIIMAIAVAGFMADIIRAKYPPFNKLVIKLMGPLMRRSEKEGMSGLPFYALGVSISLFFYQRDIAIISVMFLVFSDPLSSFFGVLYGKDKILPNKSLQGAVAGFFTCYLITLFYVMNTATLGTHILVFAIVSGVIGAASELVSAFNIDDNLTIPVLSGLGMTLLNHFVPVFG
ncbi:diacylglycerol/polyprenol kinase family protein [Peredibacter starrii]|uniref:SEC59/DGK1/VTE5 family protein n=1 Tax=Peredibacter starrii TaxID=28202 RepID=A0AAX4HP53_9BACT|nr:SEC59/DGK1/VTE5 family protein [Peredibacter starrii]WPU64872.1 SEC59/DGK1/VTE5 family protein [Peredibacter starrii]